MVEGFGLFIYLFFLQSIPRVKDLIKRVALAVPRMSCWGRGWLFWTDFVRTTTWERRWISNYNEHEFVESPWDSSVPLEQLFTTQNRQGTGVQHVLAHAPRRGDPQRLTTHGRVEKKCYLYSPHHSTRLSRLKDTEVTWQRHLNGTIMVGFSLRYTLQKYLTFHSMNIVYKYLSAFATLYTHSLSCLCSPTHNPYGGVRPHWSGT